MGGKTVGTALGAGTPGAGSFAAGVVDVIVVAGAAEPLDVLVVGGTSPVGLCAVPSSVGFRFAVPVVFVLTAVGLCGFSSDSSFSFVDTDALLSFFAGVRTCVCTGACEPMSEVSARDVESCDDWMSSFAMPNASSSSSRFSSSYKPSSSSKSSSCERRIHRSKSAMNAIRAMCRNGRMLTVLLST